MTLSILKQKTFEMTFCYSLTGINNLSLNLEPFKSI